MAKTIRLEPGQIPKRELTFFCDCCSKDLPLYLQYSEFLCRDCRREYGELADVFGMDEDVVRSNLE